MSAAEPQPVEVLLFDLGNVLVDIDFDRVFATWSAFSGKDPAHLKARFSFDLPYERHERGEIGAADYFAHLREALELELTDAQLLQGWNALFIGERAGITALLDQAKARFPLYALSNTNAAHHAVWSVRFADLLAPFSGVFVSSELGARKPEAACYQRVAHVIGVAPERILFFDDTVANIEGARAVGMQAVWVTSFEDVEEALKARV